MAQQKRSPFAFLESLGGVGAILNTLREVDVRPMRAAAERPFLLVFASRDVPLAEHLAALMYRGERFDLHPAWRAAVAVPLEATHALSRADVVVLVTAPEYLAEAQRVRQALAAANTPTLIAVVVAAQSVPPEADVVLPLINGVLDDAEAQHRIVQAVRDLRAVDELALARHLPAFRSTVVHALIDEVAIANAAYTFGSGALEINPITGVPLNVADIVVLTKNQAILAYKIALAMGLPSDFKHVMPQIAGVVGVGFLWRQAARALVGLLPGLGILPKVAVAFAGTYVVGEAVYRWCATGERLSAEALQRIYVGALSRAREVFARLRRRSPRAAKSGTVLPREVR
ncbi:MAG: hypothetical protein RMJ86_02620 [Anaerolineae bacterium]|nr:hypothetical protein [Anaerolineae bacterium]